MDSGGEYNREVQSRKSFDRRQGYGIFNFHHYCSDYYLHRLPYRIPDDSAPENVDKITDQIIEHHKGDRSFRDKEFVHYFKAGGNIWLSAMDDKFKKCCPCRNIPPWLPLWWQW